MSAVRDSGLSIRDPVGSLSGSRDIRHYLGFIFPYSKPLGSVKELTIEELFFHAMASIDKMTKKHNDGGHTALAELLKVLVSFQGMHRGVNDPIYRSHEFYRSDIRYLDPFVNKVSDVLKEICSPEYIKESEKTKIIWNVW